MSRRLLALTPILVLLFLAQAPGHTGNPPALPDSIISECPTSIPATDTSIDLVGTTFCAYGTFYDLRCKKNGTTVTVILNSGSSNSPHPYHVDRSGNIDLVSLNLHSGDSLEWEYRTAAKAGLQMGVWVSAYATTTVQ